MNSIKKYKYLQFNQGIENQTEEFVEKDDNLIELKIFKVNKNGTDQSVDSILQQMQPLFEYGTKLKYLQTELGNFEYLSLVLISTKLKYSLSNLFFSPNSEKPEGINSFLLLFKIACEINKLHKKNIIHGCIRPENIYLDSKGNPQVVNFGLRVIMDKNKSMVNDSQLIDSQSNPNYLSYMKLKGTVYEPPEMRKIKQFTHSSEIEVYGSENEVNDINFVPSGNNQIDFNDNFYTAKMDVYAYGILFYEIMCRKRLKIDDLSIKNDSVFPGDRHFPDTIRGLINQCLAINPTNRPSFPSIIAAIKKIYEDNQYNLQEECPEYFDPPGEFEIPFIDPPNDIKKIFMNASQGDVESCLIAFHILDNYSQNVDNYGVEIKKGSIQMKISINHFLLPNENFAKNGKIEILEYKQISELFYPTKVSIPLLSYEISSLTSMGDQKDCITSKCYQALKKIAIESKDPNLLLYLACTERTKSNTSNSMHRSGTIGHSTSFSISLSASQQNMKSAASAQDNEKIENIALLKDAARFGSSDALVVLGIIDLYKNNPDKRNKIAYNFKVASDMYNSYGMVNFGIMLQKLGNITKNNSLYTIAGNYFKMASQSRLEVDDCYVGLYLYNKEIEQGLVDDEASRKYDIEKKRWVDWFLTMPSGRLFVHATEDFISKSDANSSSFQSSHQTVEKTVAEMAKKGKSREDVRQMDLNTAQEYGKDIHTLYSNSAEFIQDIFDKYQNTTDFPRCPRVLCYGQTCFPVGPLYPTDDKEVASLQKLNENMCVHFYCPRCNDYYLPSQVLYKNIPGIYFPRNYLPKALKKLYQNKNFLESKPFIQYVPTIFGIPMMEAKPKKKALEKNDDSSDAAGFFVLNDSKKNQDLDNDDDE